MSDVAVGAKDTKKKKRAAHSSRSASVKSAIGKKRTFKELERYQLAEPGSKREKRAGSTSPKRTVQLN